MKQRKGFVSNSSTSSFVILGCKVTKDQIPEKYKENGYPSYYLLEKDGLYITSVEESNKEIIGVLIGSGDEYSIDICAVEVEDLEELKSFMMVFKEIYRIESAVKLYTGIEQC